MAERKAERSEHPFGPVIDEYTVAHAERDGTLVPLGASRNKVTAAALDKVMRRLCTRDDFEALDLIERRAAALVLEAKQRWAGGAILKTDHTLAVTRSREDVLWLIPNEVGGVTVMLPEDY